MERQDEELRKEAEGAGGVSGSPKGAAIEPQPVAEAAPGVAEELDVEEVIKHPRVTKLIEEQVGKAQSTRDRRISLLERELEERTRQARDLERNLYATQSARMTPEQRVQAEAQFQQSVADDGYAAGERRAKDMMSILKEHDLPDIEIDDLRLDRSSRMSYEQSVARLAKEREIERREQELAKKEKALDEQDLGKRIDTIVNRRLQKILEDRGLEATEIGAPGIASPASGSIDDYEKKITDAKKRRDGTEVMRLQREYSVLQQAKTRR